MSEPGNDEQCDVDEVLGGIVAAVDRLCRAYSAGEPDVLLGEAERLLERVEARVERDDTPGGIVGPGGTGHHDGVGDGTVADRRRDGLREQAGWLTLLISALAFDLGNVERARKAQQAAVAIADEVQSPSIRAWAYETGTWFHLTVQEYREAIESAAAGIEAATADGQEQTGAVVQLALQQAEAAGRLGDTKTMWVALERARGFLGRHPTPACPGHHFRFDHDKFDVREMRILLVAEEDEAAEPVAERLIGRLRSADGEPLHPMRLSEALAGLGLIHLRRGDVDAALEALAEAFSIGRRSRLSFQQITRAAVAALEPHREQPAVAAFLERWGSALPERDG